MKPDRIVENLLEAENLDQKLGALQGQAKEAGDLLDRTGKAMERTHPKAQHPELHQRLGDLQQKRREADGLLGKARYAAAYRTALHKVGLKPTDVVQRFGGEARQFALSTLRRGKYINAVETKDGRRVKLDPPVEVPPQTDVRGHGDNPTWMARLRIGQPRITAEQAKEQRERLERQTNAMELRSKPVAEAVGLANRVSYRETDKAELERSGVVTDFGDNAWGDFAEDGDPYLILLDEKPMGWMQLGNDGLNVIEVLPDCQRQGIATEVLRQLYGGEAPPITSPASLAGAALLRRFGVEPEMYEAAGALASVRATALAESVQIKTLKDHQKPLSEPERQQVMKAKAVWHMGKDGGPSPAVKKSVVRGRTYFWSATHRCYQSASTLKQAIRDFHKVVEPSA